MRNRIGVIVYLLIISVMCSRAAAHDPQRTPVKKAELAEMNIEDLMNVEVTSVSKKEQKMSQVAAAVTVISQEEIVRSGATNIPDILRMVPGLEVASLNASSWAISSRGFNGEFANKLLVLIDGRSVYTPLFAGVSWDVQDVLLEDIERIEVIRGPGATVWGANAVNGVINIITKRAGATLGVLVTGGGGTQQQEFGSVQYGGKFKGKTDYRIFTKYLNDGSFADSAGQNADDGWHLLHGGFRADSSLSTKDSATIQGDLYTGREGAEIDVITSISPSNSQKVVRKSNRSGGNVLSRWNHTFSSRSDMSLQFYFDRYTRSGPTSHEIRNTVDFDFHHHVAWGTRQDLIWGAGYRRSEDQTVGTLDQAWIPTSRTLPLFNIFVQDEITLVPHRVVFTAGTKLEHNDFTGIEIEPSARLAWTPNDRNTFWVAVSDAARNPSRTDSDARFGLAVFPLPDGTPVELILLGNPRNKAERLLATEVGYRAQVRNRTSIDLSIFFNNYHSLEALHQADPFFAPDPAPHLVIPIELNNDMRGTTQGIELAVNWKITDRWTLSPGYSLLLVHMHPNSTETTAVTDTEGSDPRHQAQIRSHVEMSHNLGWDTSLYFVDRLPLPPQPLRSYTRLDTQLTWRFGERIEVNLVGQNLLQDHHTESNFAATSVNVSQVKRSAYAKITWRF